MAEFCVIVVFAFCALFAESKTETYNEPEIKVVSVSDADFAEAVKLEIENK